DPAFAKSMTSILKGAGFALSTQASLRSWEEDIAGVRAFGYSFPEGQVPRRPAKGPVQLPADVRRGQGPIRLRVQQGPLSRADRDPGEGRPVEVGDAKPATARVRIRARRLFELEPGSSARRHCRRPSGEGA